MQNAPRCPKYTDKALIKSTSMCFSHVESTSTCEVEDLGLALSWPQFPHLLNGQNDLDGV